MGIYSINRHNHSEILSEGFENVEACTGSDFLEESYKNILESEENYNALMQMVGIAELAAYEATGEVVYEASDISGFVSKAKEFFKKLWEKIQGIFKKFFALVGSFTKSNKDFVNKYKKDILTANTTNFEFKGYKFTLDKDIVGNASKKLDTIVDSYTVSDVSSLSDSQLEEKIKALQDKDEIVEEMRGAALDGKGKYDANEFRTALFEKFRNGESSPETINDINVGELITYLIDENSITKTAKRSYNSLKRDVEGAIKQLDRTTKAEIKDATGDDADKASKVIRCLSDRTFLLRTKLALLEAVNGALLTAIRDRSRQAKSVCVKLIGRKGPKNESSVMENGFLSGVTFK